MRSGYCEGLKRDKVVKIARLSGCQNFVGEREREKFIFNAFVDLKPVERFENNNNNNKHDNVYGAVIMAEPLREFTRFI